nr:RNA-dependent RNA polymerase [Serpentovirales sp.]
MSSVNSLQSDYDNFTKIQDRYDKGDKKLGNIKTEWEVISHFESPNNAYKGPISTLNRPIPFISDTIIKMLKESKVPVIMKDKVKKSIQSIYAFIKDKISNDITMFNYYFRDSIETESLDISKLLSLCSTFANDELKSFISDNINIPTLSVVKDSYINYNISKCLGALNFLYSIKHKLDTVYGYDLKSDQINGMVDRVQLLMSTEKGLNKNDISYDFKSSYTFFGLYNSVKKNISVSFFSTSVITLINIEDTSFVLSSLVYDYMVRWYEQELNLLLTALIMLSDSKNEKYNFLCDLHRLYNNTKNDEQRMKFVQVVDMLVKHKMDFKEDMLFSTLYTYHILKEMGYSDLYDEFCHSGILKFKSLDLNKLSSSIMALNTSDLSITSISDKYHSVYLIDEIKGWQKYYSRVQFRMPVDDFYTKDLIRLASFIFTKNYYKKYKRLPRFKGDDSYINEITSQVVELGHYFFADYKNYSFFSDVVPYGCMVPLNRKDQKVEFLRDKATTNKACHNFTSNGIIDFLDDDNNDVSDPLDLIERNEPIKDISNEYIRYDQIKDIKTERVIRMSAKELESKREARYYAIGTIDTKSSVSWLMESVKSILNFFDDQQMKINESEKRKMIYDAGQIIGEDSIFSVMLDISGHNQSMNYYNTGPLLEFIMGIYGLEGYGNFTKLFNQSTMVFGHSYLDLNLLVHNQFGSIEGWFASLWGLHSALVMRLYTVRESIKCDMILTYSDDINALIKLSNINKDNITSYLLSIQEFYLHFGLLVKMEQCAISRRRITFLKVHYVDKIRITPEYKRIISMTAANDGYDTSDEQDITTIDSTFTSSISDADDIRTPMIIRWYYLIMQVINIMMRITPVYGDLVTSIKSILSNRVLPVYLSYIGKDCQSLVKLMNSMKINKFVFDEGYIDTDGVSIYLNIGSTRAKFTNESKYVLKDALKEILKQKMDRMSIKGLLIDDLSRNIDFRTFLFMWVHFPKTIGGFGITNPHSYLISGGSESATKVFSYLRNYVLLNPSKAGIKYLSNFIGCFSSPKPEIMRFENSATPSFVSYETHNSLVRSYLMKSINKYKIKNNLIKKWMYWRKYRDQMVKTIISINSQSFAYRVVKKYIEESPITLFSNFLDKVEKSKTVSKFLSRGEIREMHKKLSRLGLSKLGSFLKDKVFDYNIRSETVKVFENQRREMGKMVGIYYLDNLEPLISEHLNLSEIGDIKISCVSNHIVLDGIKRLRNYDMNFSIKPKYQKRNESVSFMNNVETFMYFEVLRVTKWIINASNSMLTVKGDNRNNIITTCNYILSTWRGEIADWYNYDKHLVLLATGGEVYHRLDNNSFKNSSRPMINTQLLGKFSYSYKLDMIEKTAGQDSNLNYGLLETYTMVNCVIRDLYDTRRADTYEFLLTKCDEFVDVSLMDFLFIVPEYNQQLMDIKTEISFNDAITRELSIQSQVATEYNVTQIESSKLFSYITDYTDSDHFSNQICSLKDFYQMSNYEELPDIVKDEVCAIGYKCSLTKEQIINLFDNSDIMGQVYIKDNSDELKDLRRVIISDIESSIHNAVNIPLYYWSDNMYEKLSMLLCSYLITRFEFFLNKNDMSLDLLDSLLIKNRLIARIKGLKYSSIEVSWIKKLLLNISPRPMIRMIDKAIINIEEMIRGAEMYDVRDAYPKYRREFIEERIKYQINTVREKEISYNVNEYYVSTEDLLRNIGEFGKLANTLKNVIKTYGSLKMYDSVSGSSTYHPFKSAITRLMQIKGKRFSNVFNPMSGRGDINRVLKELGIKNTSITWNTNYEKLFSYQEALIDEKFDVHKVESYSKYMNTNYDLIIYDYIYAKGSKSHNILETLFEIYNRYSNIPVLIRMNSINEQSSTMIEEMSKEFRTTLILVSCEPTPSHTIYAFFENNQRLGLDYLSFQEYLSNSTKSIKKDNVNIDYTLDGNLMVTNTMLDNVYSELANSSREYNGQFFIYVPNKYGNVDRALETLSMLNIYEGKIGIISTIKTEIFERITEDPIKNHLKKQYVKRGNKSSVREDKLNYYSLEYNQISYYLRLFESEAKKRTEMSSFDKFNDGTFKEFEEITIDDLLEIRNKEVEDSLNKKYRRVQNEVRICMGILLGGARNLDELLEMYCPTMQQSRVFRMRTVYCKVRNYLIETKKNCNFKILNKGKKMKYTKITKMMRELDERMKKNMRIDKEESKDKDKKDEDTEVKKIPLKEMFGMFNISEENAELRGEEKELINKKHVRKKDVNEADSRLEEEILKEELLRMITSDELIIEYSKEVLSETDVGWAVFDDTTKEEVINTIKKDVIASIEEGRSCSDIYNMLSVTLMSLASSNSMEYEQEDEDD